jgi:hypothetical protein
MERYLLDMFHDGAFRAAVSPRRDVGPDDCRAMLMAGRRGRQQPLRSMPSKATPSNCCSCRSPA